MTNNSILNQSLFLDLTVASNFILPSTQQLRAGQTFHSVTAVIIFLIRAINNVTSLLLILLHNNTTSFYKFLSNSNARFKTNFQSIVRIYLFLST